MSAILPATMIRRRMIGFVGHLRRNDFRVGPGETLAALDLLRRQGVHDAAAARRSLRVLLTSRQEEWERFDALFEAYLLEILSDFQITIPELGTVRATSIPHVILTSNRTRELSDALRRRCLYAYVEFPDEARELAIIQARLPDIEAALAGQIARFVQALRREDLEKVPGIAETLDWAAALVGMGVDRLERDPARLQASLICLLKTERDAQMVTREVTARLAGQAA